MIIEKWSPDRPVFDSWWVNRLTMSMWFKSFLAFLTLFNQSEDGFSISSFSCWVRLFHESRTMEGVLSDRRWRPWTTSNGPTFDTILIGPSCWYTDVLKIGYYVICYVTLFIFKWFILLRKLFYYVIDFYYVIISSSISRDGIQLAHFYKVVETIT